MASFLDAYQDEIDSAFYGEGAPIRPPETPTADFAASSTPTGTARTSSGVDWDSLQTDIDNAFSVSSPVEVPKLDSRPAISKVDLQDMVREKAALEGVPESIALRLAQVESDFNPTAVSSAGAQGLMQIMPGTQRDLGVTRPFDPEQSAEYGLRYLKQQYDRFGSWPLALAAYNAGPGRVEEAGGIPNIEETLDYVEKFKGYYTDEPAEDLGTAYPDPYREFTVRMMQEFGIPISGELTFPESAPEVGWWEQKRRDFMRGYHGLIAAYNAGRMAFAEKAIGNLKSDNPSIFYDAAGKKDARIEDLRKKMDDMSGEVALRQEAIRENPASLAYRRMVEADTWSEAWDAFLEAPIDISSSVIAESGIYLAGAPVLAANPIAGMLTIGTMAGIGEGGGEVISFLAENDINVANPDGVRRMLEQPKLAAEARKRGLTKGSIVGVAEAMAGGLGFRIGRAAMGPVKKAATGAAVGAGAGVGGEAIGSVAIGEKPKPGELLAEAVGEGAAGVVETASGAFAPSQGVGPLPSLPPEQVTVEDLGPPPAPATQGDLRAYITSEGRQVMARNYKELQEQVTAEEFADLTEGMSDEQLRAEGVEPPKPQQAQPAESKPAPKLAPKQEPLTAPIWASEAARTKALDQAIPFEDITPTGEGGAITLEDVNRAIRGVRVSPSTTSSVAAKASPSPTPKPVRPKISALEAKRRDIEAGIIQPDYDPAARALASEQEIDLLAVTPTGKEGTVVTEEDVRRAVGKRNMSARREVEVTRERAERFSRAQKAAFAQQSRAVEQDAASARRWSKIAQGRARAEKATSGLLTRPTKFTNVFQRMRVGLAPEDPIRMVFERFERMGLGDITVSTAPEIDLARRMQTDRLVPGIYQGRTITLAREVFDGDTGMSAYILAHELGHAATVDGYKTNSEFRSEVNRLYELAKEELATTNEQGDFALTDAPQFLAEAVSNIEFQRRLATMPSTNERAATLWEEFVTAVRRLLGLPVEGTSMLDEVMAVFPATAQDLAALSNRTEPAPAVYSEAHNRLGASIKKELGSPEVADAAEQFAAFYFGDEPKQYKASRLIDFRSKFRRLTGWMSSDQIIREFARHFPGGSLKKYANALAERTRIARDWQQHAAMINEEWRGMEIKNSKRMQFVAQLMHDTTIEGIRPYARQSTIAKNDLPAYKALQHRWSLLTPQEQQLYKKVERFYIQQRRAMKNALLKQLVQFKTKFPAWSGIRSNLLKALDTATEKKEVKAAFDAVRPQIPPRMRRDFADIEEAAAKVIDLASVKGPYFPLKRWGEYVVHGTEPAPPGQDGEPYVEFFDKESDAIARVKELEAQGYDLGGAPSGRLQWAYHGMEEAPRLIASLQAKMSGTKGVSEQLNVALVELLSEASLRQSDLQRRGVSGASLAMRRGFAERGYAGSWALADISTAFDRAEALQAMQEEAKHNTTAHAAVREITLREEAALKERNLSKMDSYLAQFGFLYYLAGPSFPVVNFTQPLFVTIPFLSARYGVASTHAAMARAYKAVTGTATRMISREYLDPRRWGKAPPEDIWIEMKKHLTKGEAQMIDALQHREAIDSTFMQELYFAMKGEDLTTTDKVINFFRTAPQGVETLNRVTTAVAAYNLSYNRLKHISPEQRQKRAEYAALDAVQQTQFIYSDQSKPRWFKAVPLLRSVMMFKMYTQGMMALLISSFWRAMNPQTKGGRKVAIKTLAYLSIAHSIPAGILGGIMIEPVRVVLALTQTIAKLFGDDEEDDWGSNPDRIITKLAVEALGEDVGKIVARGPYPGLGQRVGLNTLAFMSLGEDAKSYPEWYNQMIIQMGGPIVASGETILRGVEYISRGDYWKGIQTASPKFIRDAMKAIHRPLEGVTSFRGKEILGPENFNHWTSLQQAMGFTPTVEADLWASRTHKRHYYQMMKSARELLIDKWKKEPEAQRDHFFRTVIEPFNRKNPDFEVHYGHLYRSLNRQDRDEERMREEDEAYLVPRRYQEAVRRAVPY